MCIKIEFITICDITDDYIINCFSICTPSKTFIISATTPDDKRKWITKLCNAINSKKNNTSVCQMLDCPNRSIELHQDQLNSCSFCGKLCCEMCLFNFDLYTNEVVNDYNKDSQYIRLKCKECKYENNDFPIVYKAVTDKIPEGWEVKSEDPEDPNNSDYYYYHKMTNHAMKLHPSYAYYLEHEKREKDISYEYRRTYTENGEEYFQNLETGELSWSIPKKM